MFIERLLSGIVMVLLVFFGIYFGGWVWWAMVAALAIRGMYEMYRALGLKGSKITIYGYIIVALFYVVIMPALYNLTIVDGMKFLVLNTSVLEMAIIMLGFLGAMAVYVFTFPKYDYAKIFDLIIGAFYPGILISYLYIIRVYPGGLFLTWLVFIAAWGSDTFAYCTGMICKKFFTTHKMAPILSPKKSVEGGIGGLVFAGILGFIYGMLFQKDLDIFSMPVPIACAIISVAGGMISMVGDLAASAIKRNREIKDYGKLIPGHGGVMDRFDSIIFAAPCVYFLISILQMFNIY